MIPKYVSMISHIKELQSCKNRVPLSQTFKHYLPVELWEKKLAPGVSSIQYLFMNFVSKLLPLAFMKFFYCAYARRMSRFQTLIRLRDSLLNIQTLILVVFIDATMPVPELTNGKVENVPYTNKT